MAELAHTPSLPHHRLSVRGRVGTLHLDAEFSLAAPWTVIYGPSGSGKSSLLRACCGLLPGGKVLFERHIPAGASAGAWDALSGPGRHLPPYRRKLSYAPQGASLLPHLSVRDNILFAATTRPRRDANFDLADQVIELFDLKALAERRPQGLSGGEAQRVNLARACAVPDALLLLLDEPFAGADRARRDDLLTRLLPWLSGRNLPVLSVTHDVDEALLLRAEVVRLADGRVGAIGPAAEVLQPERARMIHALGASS